MKGSKKPIYWCLPDPWKLRDAQRWAAQMPAFADKLEAVGMPPPETWNEFVEQVEKYMIDGSPLDQTPLTTFITCAREVDRRVTAAWHEAGRKSDEHQRSRREKSAQKRASRFTEWQTASIPFWKPGRSKDQVAIKVKEALGLKEKTDTISRRLKIPPGRK